MASNRSFEKSKESLDIEPIKKTDLIKDNKYLEKIEIEDQWLSNKLLNMFYFLGF